MRDFVTATLIAFISFTAYSQVTILKCQVNGFFRSSNGEATKLDPSSIDVTIDNLKRDLFIDIEGNSDYATGFTSRSYISLDKSRRYESKNLTNEYKYIIEVKKYIITGNQLEVEGLITLNRLTGAINYSTKMHKNDGSMRYTLNEVNGECQKVSNSKKF